MPEVRTMSMKWTPIQERSWEIGRQISREARADPNSPYAGRWVGFVDAEIAVVADTLDEMMERLHAAQPDPARCFGIDAGADYESVHEVWLP